MAMRPECIQAVAQALGKNTLSQVEQKNIEQRITDAMNQLAKKDRDAFRAMSKSERLTEAGKIVADDIVSDKLRKNKILADDIIKQTNGMLDLIDDKLPAHEKLDRMIAFHGDMSGADTSLNTGFKTIRTEAKKELWDFYTKIKGWTRLIEDKTLKRNIVKERFGEDSGDVEAKKIADKLEKVYESLRERFNSLGGKIGDLGDRFGFNTIWSPHKLREMGRDKWNELAYKNIDRNTLMDTEGNLLDDAAVKKLLDDAYETIIMDGLNKAEYGELQVRNTGKVTNRFSDSRVLHWKNADAWLEMQDAFGELPLLDLIDYHIDGMSKSIALVEKFGSNPNRAFDILAQAAQKMDLEKLNHNPNWLQTVDIENGVKRAKTMYNAFVWREMGAGSDTVNMLGQAYRTWNVSSMLGGVVLSSINDLSSMTKLANLHGLSCTKLYWNLLKELNPFNQADKEFSYSMGIALDEITNSLSRYAIDDLGSAHSRASQMVRVSQNVAATTMRLSLINAWTRATKSAWSKTLMNKYATLTKEKDWGSLKKEDQEFLGRMGLDERTWEVMRMADPIKDANGVPLMTIESIRNIPDDMLKHLGDPTAVKDKAVKQFWGHVLDEQGMAVIEADLRERTKLFGNTHGGSLIGFFGRGMMQFKSFPTAFLMRHGSRALRDGALSPTPFTYMIPLIMGMTVLGGLSQQLSELSKGNNPLPMWDSNDPKVALEFLGKAITKGGGLSLLGDIVAAGADPMGRDSRNFLLGPLGNDIAELASMISGTSNKILNGQDVTSKFNQMYMFAKSKMPGNNLFYTKTALNRLMFDDVQNMIAPDYQQKMLKKMRKQGRSQWWKQNGDIEAPDFSGVVK
ncbi:hypothetical protein QLH32_05080 [Acinetobacter corruptisaponis]|uniref:Phage protein n=1 Tax=Acinetobacter corruptisaponis TaxID=3045147 RepID=A0ABY8S801_9GAMM|nr:hypothetical protein [Acinetobacter sp. KCTC 92772]WHP06848.1 hypothetical protein QLH32_05080 [Acinetobacter sp. KCTC 92772]